MYGYTDDGLLLACLIESFDQNKRERAYSEAYDVLQSMLSIAMSIHGPGEFTGEVNMLSGRRTLVRMRATKPSEVIELDRQHMMDLIQTDAELGEILTRAFILRRVELVAAGVGYIVLIGSIYSASTLRIKEFLMRNGHPYSYIDLESDADVQKLLDNFHIAASEIPVLICRGEVVLRNPSNQQIADCLGFNESIDQTKVRDLVVIGGGPSGLASAVYGASEGLDVLLPRNRFAWWSGWLKLKNRKLLGISNRYLRTGAGS